MPIILDQQFTLIMSFPSSDTTRKGESNDPCHALHRKVQKCHAKHDEGHSECQMARLAERRCRAFVHCPYEASHYYGTPFDEDGSIDKALCASWGESKLFADPRAMKIDSPQSTARQTALFEHHRKSLYKVQSSRPRRMKCEEYAKRLSKCMKTKGFS